MSGKEKKENSHIPLVMYGIAKAAAVDARLVQSDAEDDPNSKTNEAVTCGYELLANILIEIKAGSLVLVIVGKDSNGAVVVFGFFEGAKCLTHGLIGLAVGEENNRFAGYVNLPELVRIWSTVADTVLTREAGGVSDK